LRRIRRSSSIDVIGDITRKNRFPMTLSRAYEEVIDFIAAGPTTEHVARFRPSEAARQRVSELVRQEKAQGLTAEERSELEHYLQIEHLMRLAKARAHQRLAQDGPLTDP
jgi:hypothetical protein